MLRSIDFNDQAPFLADEIRYERADRLLLAEFEAAKTAIA